MKKSLVFLICLCVVLSGCNTKNYDTSPTELPVLSATEDQAGTSLPEPAESSINMLEKPANTPIPSQNSTLDDSKPGDEPSESADLTVSGPHSVTKEPTTPTQPVKPSTKDDKNEVEKVENTVPTTKPTTPTVPTLKDPIDPTISVTEPVATEPVVTEPEEKPTEPVPPATVPIETVPPVTEPSNTEPTVTDPPETEPELEVIDIAALESYGRSYASSAYGYNGTSACHSGTGAGYFPAATKKIASMDEGYSIVRQAIDSQYKRDLAYGYTPYEEIDGQTVRCPINISITCVEGNTYSITVYYGGTA